MARYVLLEASPWKLTDGAQEAVRLAGGGAKPYSGLRGFTDWRSGVADFPMFVAAAGYSEKGWTGGAIPQTSQIRIFPSDDALRAKLLADYHWKGAPIEIRSGDDDVAGVYVLECTGIVDNIAFSEGAIILTVADLAAKLNEPVVTAKYAGTGGIEGPAEAEGRAKRRSWGFVRNVEGFLLDKPNNIFEFGDPAFQLNAFVTVRDMGRDASPAPTTVTWQGSIAATLTALQASSPVQGSCVVAPSIACVKWWTVPVGPLTADIQGEIGTGYVNKIADMASRIAGVASVTVASADLTAINAARAAVCGVHVGDESETFAQVLDRMLIPSNVIWGLNPDGTIRLSELQLATPISEVLSADSVERLEIYKPIWQVKLGYKKNHRKHSDGEISAALLLGNVTGPTESTSFQYDYLGAADFGGTRDLTFKLLWGDGSTLTTGVTWEYRVLSGTVNGLTNASGWQSASGTGIGTVAISSLGSDTASIEVKATYSGEPKSITVPLTKTVAPAPTGGSGSGSGTMPITKSSGFTSINSTTFTDITGWMDATMPTGKTTAQLAASFDFLPGTGGTGAWTVELKWQRDVAGTPTDIGSPAVVSGNSSHTTDPDIGPIKVPASITNNKSDTPLTAGVNYKWRLVARLTSGTKTHTVSGSLSVTAP